MKVGLIDVDGHHFPNLALMKLSAYHKANGDQVSWWFPLEHYNLVYASRVFDDTYTQDVATCINADKVIYGGTGYGLQNKLPAEVEHIYPDYSIYPEFANTAYGFLTRGCPNNCPFCLVSQKEGRKSIKVADLCEFWNGQKQIKLLDPNLLACKDHLGLLEQLAAAGVWVDFTQGLDARLITKENALLLSKIKTKMVHFAFDLMENEAKILLGLKTYKEVTKIPQDKTGIYILTNFNTTHQQDLYRIEAIKALGFRPYIMIYNKAAAPPVTKHLQRWANNRIIYSTVPDFNGYKPSGGTKTIKEIYGGFTK